MNDTFCLQELTRLGERVQSALQDVEAARREASEAVARYDRAAGALEEQLSENRLLKEAGEKQRDQCHQVRHRCSQFARENEWQRRWVECIWRCTEQVKNQSTKICGAIKGCIYSMEKGRGSKGGNHMK